jgi:type VI secretion system secreted protein Hcp
MPIYLKFPGIEGEVTAGGHENWIEINSLQWGVGRGIHTPTGSSAKRESSAPSVSEVTCTKMCDKSTPKLFQEACVGQSKDVEIHITETGPDAIETFLVYKLTQSLISGFSTSSSGDRPSESLSFNFTKIEMKYTPYDEAHMPQSPIPAGYDIKLGKKV